jgi:putative membrane protein
MPRIHVSTIVLFIGGLALAGCQQTTTSSYPSQPPVEQSASESPDMGADTSMSEAETPPEPPPGPVEEEKPMLTDKGREFITKAGHAGVAEVELSKIAVASTKTARVREFAQKMIDVHTKMGEDLGALAGRLGAAAPTTLDENGQKMKDDLAKLKGKKLDQKYIDIMVEDHQKAVDLFRDQAEDEADPELQKFASESLPTIEEHLEHAKHIEKGKTYKGPQASVSHTGVAPDEAPKEP